jgi:hypothetical protein
VLQRNVLPRALLLRRFLLLLGVIFTAAAPRGAPRIGPRATPGAVGTVWCGNAAWRPSDGICGGATCCGPNQTGNTVMKTCE